MIVLLLLLAAGVPEIRLHRTETERAGSPLFDLTPNPLRESEIAARRLEETLPMGHGIAEKRSCPGRFLFPGELKEVVARRRDGTRVAAFEIQEGDLLATFSPVGEAVPIGVGGGALRVEKR